MKCRIVLDVTRLLRRLTQGRRPTGIDRVGLAYVRHFENHAQALIDLHGRILTLDDRDSRTLFATLLAEQPSHAGVTWKIGELITRNTFTRNRPKPWLDALALNTGHSGPERKTYINGLRRLGLKPIFMVHDLIPIQFPEYSRPGQAEKHVIRINQVLNVAHGIVTNSRNTIEELRQFANAGGKPLPSAVVTPLAPPELPTPRPAPPLDAPYFVVVGTIEPRKNHWLLLHIWRRLIERHGTQAPRLVIIGQRGWECENVIDLLERCATLKDFVVELPGCTDRQLVDYLAHARALLFPSFAEGYGLPLVEAMSLGVPAIVSDLPVFREFAGDIPEYLDPLDGTGWLDAIESYTRDDQPGRQAQQARLREFTPPTWRNHFAMLQQFLESLA